MSKILKTPNFATPKEKYFFPNVHFSDGSTFSCDATSLEEAENLKNEFLKTQEVVETPFEEVETESNSNLKKTNN